MAQLSTAHVLTHAAPVEAEAVRTEALARLYKRKAAVDDLIRYLEEYERTSARRAEIISISAFARC